MLTVGRTSWGHLCTFFCIGMCDCVIAGRRNRGMCCRRCCLGAGSVWRSLWLGSDDFLTTSVKQAGGQVGKECPATNPITVWRINHCQQRAVRAMEVGKIISVCASVNSLWPRHCTALYQPSWLQFRLSRSNWDLWQAKAGLGEELWAAYSEVDFWDRKSVV